MNVTDIKGLRYPVEFVIRFFYKSGHQHRQGHVVELGCGSGNNLMLYQAYGWQVTGIDISAEAIDNARHNLGGQARLIQHDLNHGIPESLDAPIDVLLMPYSLCYLSRNSVVTCLRQLAPKLAPDAEVFISLRTPEDYRYGRGVQTERNGFILNTKETGEDGLLNVFYFDHEIVALLCDELGMKADDLAILHCQFDNIQCNQLVSGNNDLIVWGKKPA